MKPTRNPFAAASCGGSHATVADSRRRGAKERRSTLRRSRLLTLSALALLGAPGAMGANIYWDGSGTGWETVGSWSTDPGLITPNPGAVPGILDLALFNISAVNTAQTVNLNAAQSALGLSFASTGTVLLQGGGTNQILTLASSGITRSGTGAVTIGSVTTGQQVSLALSASQTWANNNNTGALTILNGVAPSTATSRTLTLGGTSTAANTISGIIANNGAGVLTVNKSGTGTWLLSGANTFTGRTTISGGILQLGSATALGATSGRTTISGGSLDLNGQTVGAEPISFSGTSSLVNNSVTAASLSGTIGSLRSTSSIGGTGDLRLSGVISSSSRTSTTAWTKIGTGKLTLSGANTYARALTISAGIVNIQHATALGTIAGRTTVNANAALEIQGNITVGAEALTLNGTGISAGGALRNISGTNIYGGLITLGSATRINSDADTLRLSNIGTITGAGFGLTVGGAGNTTINSIIGTGAGTLTKDGTGILTLTGTNTYTGATTLADGVLSVATIGNGGTSGNLGAATSAAGNLVFNGGTLRYTGASATSNRSFTITAGKVATFEVTANALTLSGASPATTGGLAKSGAGTLILTGSQLYTGPTTLSAGKLALSGAGAISDSSPVTVSAGIFDISAITASGETIGSLAGASGSSVVLGGKTLTTGGDATSTGFAGVLSGSGSLIKLGAGTMTLSGSNTHTGGTTITAGALSVAASSALGPESNLLTIGSGATLKVSESFGTSRATTLGGAGSGVGGTFEVAAGKTLDYSSGSSISGTGSLIKTGTGTMLLEGTNPFTGGLYIQAGTLAANSQEALGAVPAAGSSSYGLHLSDGATFQIQVGSWATNRQLDLMGGVGKVDVTNGIIHQRNGLIYGAGKLDLVGPGTLILTGANTYTGGTLIENGVLQVNNSSGSATGTGPVTVANGGTLSGLPTAPGFPGITGSIAGTVTVQLGGELMARSGTTLGLGGLTFAAGSVSTFELGAWTATPLVNVTGSNSFTLPGSGSDPSIIDIVNTGLLSAGTYRLFDYTGTALSNLSTLVLASSNSGLFNLSLVNNTGSTSIDLLVDAVSQQWKKGGVDTNWSTAGNWWTSGVPNGAGAQALFLNNNGIAGFGAAEAVTLDANITAGSLVFQNSSTAFTLGSTSATTLTLDDTGGIATITVRSAPATANHGISVPLILADNVTVDIAAGSSGLDLSGAISGSGKTLTKTGLGPLTLSGTAANTYTGLTRVSGGTLNLNKTAGVNAIGSGGLQIDSNTTVALLASNQIADSATVTVNGTFALGNYSETIAVLAGGGAVTTGTGSVLTLSSATNSTFLGIISGTGGLAKAGSGTLTLNGTNTYTGGTAITGGILQVGADANLGGAASNLTFDGGTLSFAGGFTSARNLLLNSGGGTLDNSGSAVSLTGVLSGSGPLTKTGAGTILLTSANNFTGATTIRNGVLQIGNAAALGTTGAGTTIDAGGELELLSDGMVLTEAITLNGGSFCNGSGTNTYSGTLTLTANSFLDADSTKLTITSGISGAYGLTKDGPGIIEFKGINTYTGATHVLDGTLTLSNGTAIANAGAVILHNVAGVTLELTASETIGSLSGGGTTGGNVRLGSNTLSFGDVNDTSFGGVISGSGGALVKLGAGTMTLTGSNSYTGGTTISGGTLSVAASSALGLEAGHLTIGSGATLLATESFSTSRATTLEGGGAGAGGSFEVAAGKLLTYSSGSVISGAGSLIKKGDGSLSLRGVNTYTGGTYIMAGTLISTSGQAAGPQPPVDHPEYYAHHIYDGATLQIALGSWSTARQIELMGGTARIDITNGFTQQRNGLIHGAGKLDLVGTGTMIVTNANTYMGGTLIDNGVLQVNNSFNPATDDLATHSATGAGAVTVASGGTLSGLPTAVGEGFTGITGAIAGTVLIENGGKLLTRSGTTLTLGGLALDDGSLSTFQLGAWTATPLVNVTGNNLFTLLGADTSPATISIVNTGAMGIGTYRLFDYTGTAFTDISTLALANLNSGLFNLSLVNNTGSTSIDLDVTAIVQQWQKNGTNTKWSENHWWTVSPYTVPNAPGAAAAFINNNPLGGGTAFETTETVTIDTSNKTVGSIAFNNATTAFTITSSGLSLILNNNGVDASIQVINGPAAANHMIGAPIILEDDLTVDIAAGGLNLSGAISGDQALTKTGTGPLTLSGTVANSYSGPTEVAGGSLNLNKTAGFNAIGSGGLQINSGATVTWLASNQIADDAAVSVNGTFALGGHAETIAGLGGGGAVTTGSGGVLTVSGDADSTFLGTISGAGGLAKAGAGTLTLNGINSYTGGTAIHAGAVQVGADTNLGGTGAITFNGGTLSFSGSFTSARNITLNSGGGTLDTSGSSVTLTGLLSGAGTLTKEGTGTIFLNRANTYTGATVINDGILQIGNATALGTTGAGTTINPGGELEFNGSGLTLNESLTLSGGAFCNGSGTNTHSGTLTLTANSFLDADDGTLIIATGIGESGGSYGFTMDTPGTIELKGTNAYTGATHVQNGTLSLFNGAAIANTGAVLLHDVAGATLKLNTSETIGSLAGGGATGGNVVLGANTLTTGDASDTSFGGSISGVGGILVKQGAGTLTLTGSNTHTGGTTITGGKLSVATSVALGSETNLLTIGGGATLQATDSFSTSRATTLGGAGAGVGGTFEVATGKVLTYTSGSVIGGTGSLIKTGAGTLSVGGVGTYTGGTYLKEGTLVSTSGLAAGPQPPADHPEYYAHHIYDGATLQIAGGSWSTARQVELVGDKVGLGGSARIDIANGFTQQRNGLIYGAGKLNLVGAGTMIVTNANTYTGGTLIGNGTLQVSNSTGSATGTGAVTVANGGTLKGSTTVGKGFITGTVNVQSGGTVAAFSGETLTLGSLTLGAGSLGTFQLGAVTDTSMVTILGSNAFIPPSSNTSTLTIVNTGAMGVGTYRLFDYSGNAFTDISTLALADANSGLFNLSLVNNAANTSIDLEVTAINVQWKKGGSNTNWSDAGNWWAGAVPDGIGVEALFINNNGTAGFGTTETVTLDTSKTVGEIVFQNPTTAFTISAPAGQTLTLNESGGGALISVLATPATAHISASLILADNLTVDIAAGGSGLDLSGAISGIDQTVTKTGTGPLTLSGAAANTYIGLTTVVAGTLNLNKTAGVDAIGSGGLQIDSGATATWLASNQIADSATVTVIGTFALGTHSETIGRLAGGGSVTTGSGGVLTLSSATNSTFIGVISGAGGLVKAGTGMLTLNGTNTYTGGTAINAGTLQVGADSNLGGAGDLTFGGGTLHFSTGFTSARNVVLNSGGGTIETDGTSAALTGLISGSGTLTKAGAGTLTLTGNNTFTGATIVSGGTLSIAADSGLGTAPGSATAAHLVLGGGTLAATETFTLNSNRGVLLTTTGTLDVAAAKTLTYSGIIAGSGGLTKAGTGTLELFGSNTFGGDLTLNASTLVINSGASLGSDQLIFAGNGTLKLAADVTSARSFVFNDGVAATLDTNGHALVQSGILSGTGTLTKTGIGTLTLTGSNTFTGTTTISGGTLSISGNANLGAVATGATLYLTGGATLQATASIALDNSGANSRNLVVGGAGGTLQTVNSGQTLTVSGVISGTGDLTVSGAGTLLLTGTNTLNGAMTINPGSTLRQGDGGAGGSLSGTVGITNNGALIYNRSGTYLYSNVISGSGTFEKTGSSMLTLTGTNTYTGVTTISGGTLQLGDGFTDGSISSSSGITNNSALIFNVATSASYSHVIGGTGTLTKSGVGALTLGGTNTYSGVTTITGGTLNIAADSGLGAVPGTATAGHLVLSGGTLAATGTFTLNSKRGLTTGGSLDVAADKTLTYGGIAAGSGALTKTGTGTLVLTGANTYTGATFISGGTLQLGDGTTNGSLAAASAVTANGALIYHVADSTSQTTSNAISGSGTFTKSGTGTLVFTGISSFSGSVTIGAGTLQIGDATHIGALGNATSITNNGTLVNKNNVLASTFSRVLGGTGAFIMDSGSANTLTMSGANTYSGATTITSGTLKLGHATALGDIAAGTTVASGAALDLLGQTVGAEALTLSGTGISAGGALINSDGTAASLSGNITLAAASSVGGSGPMTLGGVISGSSMALTKVGAGILTLTGNNTYSGNTEIVAGELRVNNPPVLDGGVNVSTGTGSGTVTLASGATLSGTGRIAGSVTVATGTGAITAGNGVSGSLAIGGDLAFTGAGIINIGTLSNYTSSAALAVAGALSLNGGTGAVTLALPNGAVSNGTYHLVSYGNTFSNLAGFSVSGPDIGGRQIAALQNNTGTINYIDYVVSGAVPYWSGIASTEWSTNTIAGSKNWKLDASSPTDFLATDTVLFNNNATNTTADITVADVTPVNVSVSGSKDFTFTGTKAIAGTGSLTIDSTGSLTISTANTFSGGTSLNAGTLKISTATALGTGTVTLNGGTLSSDSTAARSLANNLVIGGNVTLGNATNTGALTFSGTVDLDGSTHQITTASDVTLSGIISGANGGLSKAGAGTFTLSGHNTFTSDVNIGAGTLAVNYSDSLGAPGGMLTFTGNSTLRADATITVTRDYVINSSVTATIDTNGHDLTNAGIVTGSGAVTKTGAGIFTLTGVNTYSGATTISNGTLRIGAGTTDGSIASSSAIVNNSVVVYDLVNSRTFSKVISGSGSVTKEGNGTMTLTGLNTYTGATLISAGTLQLGDGITNGSISASSGITNNSALVYNLPDSSSYDKVISGSGTLTKTGAGTLTLSNTNTYTDQTSVNGGTLSILSNANLGAVATGATLNLNGGTLQAITNDITLDNSGANQRGIVLGSAGGAFDTATSNKTLTVTGVISGSGALTKTGTGNLSLSGLNTYTGATTVTGGTLSIAADSGLGTAPAAITAGQLVLTGSTLAATDTFTLNSSRGVQLTTTSTLDVVSDKTLTYSGIIAGAGGLTKSGTGTLELLGRNQFEGVITHNAGTLVINSGLSLGSYVSGETGGQLIFAGDATLKLAADVNAARSFVFNDGKTATIDTGGHSFAQGGVFSGGGGLTKTGPGSLTLAGTTANTYSGLTTLNESELNLNKSPNTLAMGGNLTIGDGTGGANADVVTLLASGQLPGTAAVLINGTSGKLDLNGNAQTLGSLADTGTVTANGSSLALGISGALTVGDATASTTFSGEISGVGGTLTKQGSGTLVLAGSTANTYSGLTTVIAGELDLNKSANTLAMSGHLTIGDGTGGANADVVKLLASGQLGSSVAVLVNGTSGKFDLNGNAQTIGSLADTGTVTAGGSSLALGAGALTVGDANSTTFSGAITGSGGMLTKQGNGTLQLAGSNANTYNGMTTIIAGELDLNKTAGVNAVGGELTIGGGTLKWLANEQLDNGTTTALVLDSGTVSLNGKTETLGSFANNGGTFTTGEGGHLIGTGATITWTSGTNTINDGGLVADAHLVISGGTNTVQGGTTGGVLQLSSGGTGLEMSNGSTLTLNSDNAVTGKLRLQGNVSTSGDATVTIASGLALTNKGTIDLDGGTRTFTVADGGATIDMAVSAAIINGGLTKAGPGTLTLSGTNTYTGATTVSGGTLTIGSTGTINSTSGVVIGAGEFTYNSATPLTKGITFSGAGGTLSGTGPIGTAVTVTLGNTHAPGGAGTVDAVGTQDFASDLNYAAGSIFEWDLNENQIGTAFDMVGGNGAVTVDTSNTTFKIVFGDKVDMNNDFWSAPWVTRTWAMTSIFGSGFSGAFAKVDTGTYPVNPLGTFTISGTSLVYSTVPEPTNAVVGLLLGAALLRRQRGKETGRGPETGSKFNSPERESFPA